MPPPRWARELICMAMRDDDKQSAPGLGSMEIMGALTVRLIHDLTNHFTILSGNAQVLEMVRDNPERLPKVLERIKHSTEVATDLVNRFSEFRQQLVFRTEPHLLTECERELAALNPTGGRWTATTAGELEGELALEPRWIAFAVWQTALQSGAGNGVARLSSGEFPPDWQGLGHVPDRLKSRPLFRCELEWEGPGPWLDEKEAVKPMNLHLAVVYELVKVVDGWVHYQFLPENRHQFNFFIPLFGRD